MLISEVCKKIDLTQDALRYYERIGLIPKVRCTKGGIRDYTEEDLRWVEFVRYMRGVGVPIEALVNYVALFQQGDSTQETRKQILVEQLCLLEEQKKRLEETIEQLRLKIANHEQTIKDAETYLALLHQH